MLNTALLLTASMVIGPAEDGASGGEQLKAYGQAVVGKWTGKGMLSYDVPGIGEKGQEMTGTANTRWVLKKTAIQCDWKFGEAVGKWVAVWDAEKKVIRLFNCNSAGNFAVGTVSKQGGKWISKVKGASGEGKSFAGTAVMSVADDGNTIVWNEVEQMLGGEKQPDFQHTWKRVVK